MSKKKKWFIVIILILVAVDAIIGYFICNEKKDQIIVKSEVGDGRLHLIYQDEQSLKSNYVSDKKPIAFAIPKKDYHHYSLFTQYGKPYFYSKSGMLQNFPFQPTIKDGQTTTLKFKIFTKGTNPNPTIQNTYLAILSGLVKHTTVLINKNCIGLKLVDTKPSFSYMQSQLQDDLAALILNDKNEEIEKWISDNITSRSPNPVFTTTRHPKEISIYYFPTLDQSSISTPTTNQIVLTGKADPSTLLHEMLHCYNLEHQKYFDIPNDHRNLMLEQKKGKYDRDRLNLRQLYHIWKEESKLQNLSDITLLHQYHMNE